MLNHAAKRHILGIIGGMGKSTSDKFIEKLAIRYSNMPVYYILAQHHGLDPKKEPGYIKEGLYQEDFEKVVVHAAMHLVNHGVTHIALICNTAHQHENAILSALKISNVKFLSIVNAVKNEVQLNNLQKILIMATFNTTFKICLYDSLPNIVKPCFEDQQIIDDIILKILKKEIIAQDIIMLINIALNYKTDGILFACTDLAVIIDEFKKQLSLIDKPKVILESTQALENMIHTIRIEHKDYEDKSVE